MAVKDLVHVWQACHHCGMKPIVGVRYQCLTCPAGPNSDLCENCYQRYENDQSLHPASGLGLSNNKTNNKTHQFSPKSGQPLESFHHWFEVYPRVAINKTVGTGFIVRPEFLCDRQSFYGGHGFIVKAGNKVLLVTALHVLDELIKAKGLDASISNPDYSGSELPALVSGVNLYDVLKSPWILHQLGVADTMLKLAQARTGEEEPYCCRDIAAFEVANYENFVPHDIAASLPEIGEPVWLIARTESHGFSHQAVVVDVTEKSMVYRYLDSDIPFRATSGAPVINTKNEVVGINVGAGAYGDCLFGHANHSSNIRWHLDFLLQN
jgi:hypothetical protein